MCDGVRRVRPGLMPVLVITALLLGGTIAARCSGREPLAASRDWTKSPAIVDLQTTSTIVAVGDVHGDYKRLVHLLKRVELVPEAADQPADIEWAGGTTVLICTGDLIDKGDRSLDVISCFRTLQGKAAAAGGRVIVTMGNHEAEFLADPDDDDKAEQFVAELEQAEIKPEKVAAGTDKLGIGQFLAGLPLAVKVNDWFFAHAGSTQGLTLATLDGEIKDSVKAEGFDTHVLLGKRGLLEARLKPLPWWEREGDTAAESQARLRGYATALGVKHLVMGHQPGKATFSDGTTREAGEMTQKFDGLIFFIDVGMSKAINKSKGAALKIEQHGDRESATAVHAEDRQDLLWSK
ncbi:MAG TPA: metallophosphoesterase [Pirellulales bacterium]|nr:metallophosphoesterase [Pirellulales bacterium]